MERLILIATEEDDIVLDPFFGTGTSGIAARRLGRQCIGFDHDADYIALAEQKIAAEQFISKLGNCWVSFHLGAVQTLRDQDWPMLESYFNIPAHPQDVDTQKCSLKKI